MNSSSNPPNSAPERSFSTVDQFVGSLSYEEQGVLKYILETSDPNDMAIIPRLRNAHGERAVQILAAVNELVAAYGCPYTSMREAMLNRLANVPTSDPAPAQYPVAAEETGQWSIPPSSLSPEEIAKGATIEERGMLQALLTLDDVSDIGAVVQLSKQENYSDTQRKALLNLAGDLTRLPGNLDENRGRIMAALTDMTVLGQAIEIGPRETSEWNSTVMTPEAFFRFLTDEGQVMLGAYISLEDKKNEKALNRLRKRYGADAMNDIITHVESMSGYPEEVYRKFSVLLTGRQTISFNPNDEDMVSGNPPNSSDEYEFSDSERPTPVMAIEIPEEAIPPGKQINMADIWNEMPHEQMTVDQFVQNLTPEGQELLRDLVNVDVRDATALSKLEKEHGKKGHTALAVRMIELMNRGLRLEEFEVSLGALSDDCVYVPTFPEAAANKQPVSPWAVVQSEKASEDPLGDFLNNLSEQERNELEQHLRQGGQNARMLAGIGPKVIKMVIRKEPGFDSIELVLGRLEAMRIAQVANGSDYGGHAAFTGDAPELSDSPWMQHAKPASSPKPPASPVPPKGVFRSTNSTNNVAEEVAPYLHAAQKREKPARTFASVVEMVESGCNENELISDLTPAEQAALEDYMQLRNRDDVSAVNELTGKHGKIFWEVSRAIDILAERRKVSVNAMFAALKVKLAGGSITDDHFIPRVVVESKISDEERRQRQAHTVINRKPKSLKSIIGGALIGPRKKKAK